MSEENERVAKLSRNPISVSKTRHIDVRFHIVCENVEDGTKTVVHVESKKQAANGLAKNHDEAIFWQHQKRLLNTDC